MKFFEGEQGEQNMWIVIGGLFFCTSVAIVIWLGTELSKASGMTVVHTEEPVFQVIEYKPKQEETVDWEKIEITEIDLSDIPVEGVEEVKEPVVDTNYSDVVTETITEEIIFSDTEEAVVIQTETYDYCPDISLDPALQDFTKKKCAEYSVSYPLILALMESESSFNKNVGNEKILGSEGERKYYGYMQLSADNCNKAEQNGINAHTPEGNIEWGIKLMSDYIKKYNEVEAVISAYKCGEGAADSGKRVNCDKIIERTMYFSELLGVD